MKRFIIAMQFLTVIRLSRGIQITSEELGKSMGYFPLVGLLLGCILAIINMVFLHILPGSVVDGILIITLIFCTGAFHLDGFADTVDGLAGGNTKEEILKIMRDSRTGAIGVVGVTMVLLLKYASLVNIPDEIKNQVLIAMPMIGRCSMVQVSFFCDYARSGQGIGSPFSFHVSDGDFLMAATTTIVLSVILLGLKGIIVIAVIGMSTWGLITLYKKKVGGTTGDTFGATNEISEVLVLILVLALLN